MEIVEKDYTVVQNKKAKSSVWEHFGLKKRKLDNVVEDNLAICRECDIAVKCSGGTTNLSTHIRRHHPLLNVVRAKNLSESNRPTTSQHVSVKCEGIPKASKANSQLTLGSMFVNMKKYHSTSPRASSITDRIARFIINDLRPYRIVDSPDFKAMVSVLDPKYVVPSRKQFSEVIIPEMYATVKRDVLKSLKDAEQVALTSDGWTSRSTESYVTITATFITECWELENYVLQTRALPQSHTAENLADELNAAIIEWQLPTLHGIPPMVTDNAANATKAVRLTKSQTQVGCLAHTINLAVQKSLKVKRVSHVLAIIRKIVSFFHRSTVAAGLLKAKAEMLGLPNHKLKIDVTTRWNSAYDMADRFLEMQCATLAALRSKELAKVNRDIHTPSDDDINLLEDIVQCLKPMKDVTTMLCTESVPTVSIILPIQHTLINSVLLRKDSDSPAIREMKSIMADDLTKRYQDPELVSTLIISSAIDPRFKQLSHLSETDKLKVFADMTELHVIVNVASDSLSESGKFATASSSINDNAQCTTTNTGLQSEKLPPLPVLPVLTHQKGDADSTSTMSTTHDITCDDCDAGLSELSNIDGHGDTSKDTSTTTAVIKSVPTTSNTNKPSVLQNLLGGVYVNVPVVEISKSLEEMAQLQVAVYKDASNINLNECPLTWWKANENTFPLVAKLARCLLCIPATSVPSERVFSTAGDIINGQRATLKWKHVDQLIFLKKNMK